MCLLKIIALGEHLMAFGRVFHNMAAAVSINRLPSFTVLLLFGTNDDVFADLTILVGWYQFNNSRISRWEPLQIYGIYIVT